MKKTYLKPHSKVLEFKTYHETMVYDDKDGDPFGSYKVNELEPNEPITIGGDEDAKAAPFMKNLWDFEE
ncbi:MAG: hypothetical protein II449_02595 [Prevotella sp.]|nr:hypothetical protein [Prevotella sp.]MBQ2496541.1 hypothetical protein [Prevotella sp.]MBQ4029204.1 hypothetical protein [Prevotella sp.]